jgi:cytoskeletal protein CcmA (bactofilin family)
MFRRKEENAADPSNSAAAAPGTSSSNGYGDSNASSSSSSASASGAQAASNTYVPTAPSSRSTPSESARSTGPVSNYRPTPIAEFNRGAARGAADAMRSSSPSSSFGATGDKSHVGKANRRVLTVGNDILLKGEIATCDRLVIEGRVEAKLSEVHTVEIAECGSFKGTAEVEDAEISGVFEGDLIVRNRLVVYGSGEVRGNISYGEIEIERGGRLTGQIKTVAAGQAKGKPFDGMGVGGEKRKETAAA